MNDGNIRIGIKITELDGEIKRLQSKLRKLKDEEDKIKETKIAPKVDTKELEYAKKKVEELRARYEQQITTGDVAGSLTGIELNNAEANVERLNRDLIEQNETIRNAGTELKRNAQQQEEIREKIEECVKEQQRLNMEQAQNYTNTKETKNETKGLGQMITKVTKNVIKWGLAVFSVRSMYLFVRKAVSTLSSYNKQMATDIQYIQYALAQMIKPIIEWVINAMYKIHI